MEAADVSFSDVRSQQVGVKFVQIVMTRAACSEQDWKLEKVIQDDGKGKCKLNKTDTGGPLSIVQIVMTRAACSQQDWKLSLMEKMKDGNENLDQIRGKER